jgi:hypothetical protein
LNNTLIQRIILKRVKFLAGDVIWMHPNLPEIILLEKVPGVVK